MGNFLKVIKILYLNWVEDYEKYFFYVEMMEIKGSYVIRIFLEI